MPSFLPRSLPLSLAAGFALMACGKETPPPPPAAGAVALPPLVIKIGHAAPLTGPQAHIGKDNENGVRMALDDANAEKIKLGGREVTFELMSEDDQADPKQGNLVAQKFVDANVSAVIGHLNSGTTIPASKLYADAGIPQVSPSSTNPAYTEQGFKTTFRVMANDAQQGKTLGDYAASHLQVKTVAIVDDKTAYGEGLAGEFKKAAVAAGIQVVAEEHTDDKAVDFKAILTRIKGKAPDLVFYGGMDPQAAPMARQMKALGLKTRLLMGDGGCTTEFIRNAGDAATGHWCSLPGIPYEKMPGGPGFIERFRAKYGEIQLYAPYAYDAARVVVDAIKRAQSVEPAKIVAEMPKTNYKGVTATLVFDDKGDIKNGAVSLYTARDGKWVVVDTLGGPPAAVVATPAGMSAMNGPAAPAGMAVTPTDGTDLAKRKNCLSCHAVDKKMVGPSYKEVAARYAGNTAAAKELAAKVRAGGKGVWGQIPMPPNAGVSEQEAETLVAWILAGAK